MKNLGDIAAVLHEVYNNGRTTDSDQKLDYEDFLELVMNAYGEIINIEYYKQLRAGQQDDYFAQNIQTAALDIQSEDGKPPFVTLEGFLNLPYAAGIQAVYPYSKDYFRDTEYDYLRLRKGAERQFGNPKRMDDLGLRFFVVRGRDLLLYGGEGKGQVTVEYLPFGEDIDVPMGVEMVIMREVYKIAMPTRQIPVDTTEDTDPNIRTKQGLQQNQNI